MAARARTYPYPTVLVAIAAGVLVQIAAYWPGIMIWDSTAQYTQALSGHYDDWHPPAMNWLWRQLRLIHPGPAPFFILQMLLYWGGFASWSGWALRQRRPLLAIGIVGCALIPVGFALIGAMIKDSLMAGALLTASSLLAWVDAIDRRHVRRIWILRIVAASLVLFSATLRFNAFVAGVPLLVALMPAAWRGTRGRMALMSVLAAIPLFLAVPVANRLLHAERSGVEYSLIIFDLAGITEFSGVDVFPKVAVADPVEVNDNCYIPEKWDPYAWWDKDHCPIDFGKVRAALKASGQSPYRFWLSAIAAHPLAYAEHRIMHFNSNTYFLVRDEDYDEDDSPAFSQSDPNPWHYQIRQNDIEPVIEQIVLTTLETPLGWPIWWMAMTVGVLILSPRLPSRAIILPIGLSALLYGLAYIVVSVASEMRYHFWTMTGAAIVIVIAASDLRKDVPVSRRRVALAVAPAVLVALLGTGWRLAPLMG
jgi:hypothetical protein